MSEAAPEPVADAAPEAPAAEAPTAPEAVEVEQRPHAEREQPVVKDEPFYEKFEDAVKALLGFVDDGRRAGDKDVDVAREHVRADLAKNEPAPEAAPAEAPADAPAEDAQ